MNGKALKTYEPMAVFRTIAKRQIARAAATFLLLGLLPAAAADRSPEINMKAVVLGGEYGLAADDFGYFVVDVDDGRVVAELNADKTFMPASVIKIPTTAAALEILGSGHRFATTILTEGTIVGGILAGALTIRGGGDPLLTGDHLQLLAKEIARAGIKEVSGGFYYDATHHAETPQINALQPEAAGYNPAVSALSVNFNRVRWNWRNGGDGPSGKATAVSDKVTVPLEAIGFAPAEETLPGALARAGLPIDDSWLVSRKISSRGEDWLPVGNPALVAAEILRQLAAKEGVKLPEPKPRVATSRAKEIARYESPDLALIVRVILRHSNNMSAELVGLAATKAETGFPLTLEGSAESLAYWWRQRLPDVNWDGFYLENLSGLSSKSRMSPRQVVAMLLHAAEPIGGADYHDLLRAASWKANNGKTVRIRAKTGTIAYGRGLAGYIDAANGRRLAFAIFANDVERRAALDAAFDPRVENINNAWRKWRRRALRMEQKLLNGWATGSP